MGHLIHSLSWDISKNNPSKQLRGYFYAIKMAGVVGLARLRPSPVFSVLLKTKMAGVVGLEPTNVGTRTRCLTTWRHPSVTLIIPQVYSLRNASTGSFLDAARAGMSPPTSVKTIERTIKNAAILGSRVAESGISPVKWCKTRLINGINRYDIPTPNKPESYPIIKVSALNIEEILCFDAPIARNIPISFVLS